ncbi:MAG: cyclase family protein [Hyphomicrobiaceae bacterium]
MHNGTHLDAPYHYHSTMNNGEQAMTIDELPLEWCIGRGVKLDFRKFADGYVASPADVMRELERIGHRLAPLDIVVINTAASDHYGTDRCVTSGCGMGREATLFLLRQGARNRHRRLELGCTVRLYGAAGQRYRRCVLDLGTPSCRNGDRVLLFSGEDQGSEHRVVSRRRNC